MTVGELFVAAVIITGLVSLLLLIVLSLALVIDAFRRPDDPRSDSVQLAGDRIGTCRSCHGAVQLDPCVGTVSCPCGEADMPDDLLELEVTYALPSRQGAAW